MVHGKEPTHFLAMFGGQLRIYEGGKAGWGQSKDTGRGDTYLLQVRGTSITNCKAEQVSIFHSNCLFVNGTSTAILFFSRTDHVNFYHYDN